ncbi:MAG: hypothetical protein WCQ97_02735 [Aminobacterium sp.]|uniref:Uncharacterized protein n=1 Tax=bioreactor metagenome TaxID=1076179 RepID=A0A645G6X2_9ZZZZ|nr:MULTISPECIES: hypothetical protein [unclassified Aminobacterium]MDD2206051.1 hypothetical protein [Aminobacterium sp.]MDD3425624.1 hypothetical protein [Aminobacterium sp.]MDD3708058.1 hypothetical protein [Aminobacterium sp.]MDD4227792.1 hypothetical protein [Aminobacterium sp.]MDD4550768.1 hypothetical protein [Aminobacterium sp.]
MFIPLEGQGIISAGKIIAIVRHGDETALYTKDGSVVATGFKPETLSRRYRAFVKESRRNALDFKQKHQGGDSV